MKRKSHLRFYTNLLLTSALAIGGNFSLAKLALAAGTAAGTVITNTATGSFEGDTSGTTGTVTSNAVTLSVLEIAGVTLTPSGTTQPSTTTLATDFPTVIPGPYQGTEGINRGDIVYFDFTITNTGNSPTAIFIPDITTITNGTQRGINVIQVDPDGAVVTNAPTTLNVPVTGGGSDTITLLGATNGYIPVNGTVTVRVAVEVTGLNVNDTTTVVLGNTAVANGQNEDYIASTSPVNRDVYTVDLTNGTAIPNTGYSGAGYLGVVGIDQTLETNGDPVNGDAALRRKEASNTSTTLITAAIDYGDALDASIFNTLIVPASSYANSGASHIINAAIRMGTTATDAEANGVDSVNADGDDIAGATPDDEDGVTLPTLLTSTTIYSVTVDVTNTTASPAYLVGWIDFNKNGTFEVGEAQIFDNTSANSTAIDGSTTVPPNPPGTITTITPIPSGANGLKTLTWTVPAGLLATDVLYARFRLTTDLNVIGSANVGSIVAQPNRPLGVGEVEDYRIAVGAATPNLNTVKRITSIAGVDILNDFPSTVTGTSNVGDPKWPQPPATYLRGGVDCTAVGAGATCNGVQGGRPGDVVEYTIYFLANGNDNLRNVKICDAIPTNTTYVPGSMILGWDGVGTLLPNPDAALTAGETGLTDAAGGDIGTFLGIGVIDAANAPTGSVCQTGTNPTGAVFINFGATPVIPFATANGALNAASPNRAYGFIRFRVTVN